MTTTEIVQRLLKDGHITAEEAVTILKDTIQQGGPIYIPPAPIQPSSPPYKPGYGDFWYTTSTSVAGSKEEGNE